MLPFGERSKSRLRAVLDNGEEAGLFLERGSVLRDGDLLLADDGRVVEVQAATETVSTVHTARRAACSRAPAITSATGTWRCRSAGWLRYQHDHVLDDMLRGFGLEVRGRAGAVRTRRRRVCRGLAPRALARTSARLRPRGAGERRGAAGVDAAAAAAAPGESRAADRRVSFLAGPRVRGRSRLGARRSHGARVDRRHRRREPGDARSAGAASAARCVDARTITRPCCAGTHSSSPVAKPRSCAPKTGTWARRCCGCWPSSSSRTELFSAECRRRVPGCRMPRRLRSPARAGASTPQRRACKPMPGPGSKTRCWRP